MLPVYVAVGMVAVVLLVVPVVYYKPLGMLIGAVGGGLIGSWIGHVITQYVMWRYFSSHLWLVKLEPPDPQWYWLLTGAALVTYAFAIEPLYNPDKE